nr:type II toxin-antitoxin system prevent-host-death family antitoxin [Clostridium indicum]
MELLADKKVKFKVPMEQLNIAEFNRGQSSKLIRSLVEEDKVAEILKHGKTIAVVLSYERYKRLLEKGIDINDF